MRHHAGPQMPRGQSSLGLDLALYLATDSYPVIPFLVDWQSSD